MVPTWPTGSPDPSPPPTTHTPFYVYWVLCPYLPPPPPSFHCFLSSLHLFYKPKRPLLPAHPFDLRCSGGAATFDKPIPAGWQHFGGHYGRPRPWGRNSTGTWNRRTRTPGRVPLPLNWNSEPLPYLFLRHNLNLIKLPPPLIHLPRLLLSGLSKQTQGFPEPLWNLKAAQEPLEGTVTEPEEHLFLNGCGRRTRPRNRFDKTAKQLNQSLPSPPPLTPPLYVRLCDPLTRDNHSLSDCILHLSSMEALLPPPILDLVTCTQAAVASALEPLPKERRTVS